MAGLFFFSIVVRILTAEYVENGGDCITLWLNIRRFWEGLGFNAWNHHTMRWAITMPLIAVTKVFGTSAWVYYLLPTLYSSVAAVLVCLIGERLHSVRLGVISSILFILYPQMAQTGSQIWPAVFELTYILGSVLCIFIWLDKKHLGWLVAAALCFVLAWGSRVTCIYFFPGLLALIWLPTRSFKAVFVFCAAVGAFLCIEHLCIYAVTGEPLGRIGVIKGTHGAQAELQTSLSDYLLNFLNYKKLRGLLIVTVVTVLVALSMLRSREQRRKALAVLYLVHLVMLTWMVSSVSPLKLALPVGSRYVCASIPFGLLLTTLWLYDLHKGKPRLATTLLCLFIAAFTYFSVAKIPGNNSILQTRRDAIVLGDALASNDPIYIRYIPWQPNFVEKAVIEYFGGKARKKSVDASDVRRFMDKNRNRIVSLYMRDTAEAAANYSRRPVRIGRYLYTFSELAEGDERFENAVTVEFGRKSFEAKPGAPEL
ncbi:hypothetical protein JCM12178A_08190 [Salidesulfovibrio brasiliensis]